MFLPDTIDFTESKKYILSIRLTPNGFYFSIHCPSDESIFYQNSITFRPNSDYLKSIEKLIFNYSFFSYNYKQINVISVDDETTLVPNKFYDKKQENDFLSFNCLSPKLHVASNRLQGLDFRIVWGIEKSVHSFLSRALLNPYFASHLSFLVPTFYKLHNISTSALFVNFNDDKLIDMVAFSRDKFTLAKTITANNPLEESYYIQKTWEALGLNIQSDILFFSGRTASHSECIDTLKKVVLKTEDLSLKLPSTTKIIKEGVPTEILNQLCEL